MVQYKFEKLLRLKDIKNLSFIIILSTLFLSCDKKGIGDLSSYDENGVLHSVVSYGAGSVLPYEYDSEAKGFKNRVENGEQRKINFLPPPFNHGIIPSTNYNGSAIETIILSKGFSTGTLLKVIEIGALEFSFNGNNHIKVVCIPFDKQAQYIKTKDINNLEVDYPGSLEIIKLWMSSQGYQFQSLLNKDFTKNFIKERSTR